MKKLGLFVVIAVTLNCGGGGNGKSGDAISPGSDGGSQIGSYNDDGGRNDGGGAGNNVDVSTSTGNGSDGGGDCGGADASIPNGSGSAGGDGGNIEDAPVFVSIDGGSCWSVGRSCDGDTGGDGSGIDDGDNIQTEESALAALKELEDNGSIPKLDRSSAVEGVDLDKNGIRDDVEEYIRTHYKVPAQQKAALQFAATVQSSLLADPTSSGRVQDVSKKMVSAVSCIYTRFDNDVEPETVVSEVRSISTNTKTRLLAYLAFAGALDGTVVTLPEGDSCE